jgi:hypothetical protein
MVNGASQARRRAWAAKALRQLDAEPGSFADLDEGPILVPACDWPAGVTCVDQRGLYSWVVDSTGAADLSRGLGCDVMRVASTRGRPGPRL